MNKGHIHIPLFLSEPYLCLRLWAFPYKTTCLDACLGCELWGLQVNADKIWDSSLRLARALQGRSLTRTSTGGNAFTYRAILLSFLRLFINVFSSIIKYILLTIGSL
jgi:hypothetical protein